VKSWIDPNALGAVTDIRREGVHSAALARVTYADSKATSWLVLVKAASTQDMALDVRFYSKTNETFPNQPTLDQFFDDNQWESYRWLGERTASSVFK
jgi:hypothetical protein